MQCGSQKLVGYIYRHNASLQQNRLFKMEKKNEQVRMCDIVLCCILFFWVMAARSEGLDSNGGVVEVKIGLIVDLNSSMGVMVESCIAMAQYDFYRSHPSYRTKLAFHTKNSHKALAAASGGM